MCPLIAGLFINNILRPLGPSPAALLPHLSSMLMHLLTKRTNFPWGNPPLLYPWLEKRATSQAPFEKCDRPFSSFGLSLTPAPPSVDQAPAVSSLTPPSGPPPLFYRQGCRNVMDIFSGSFQLLRKIINIQGQNEGK